MKADETNFDVVTDTAVAHAVAWAHLFNDYLQDRSRKRGEPFRPFDPDRDYHLYVDGKPRSDGVESFLASRGISLPRGNANDAPDRETICGLGNRKNCYFAAWLEWHQVRAFPGTLAFIGELKRAGKRIRGVLIQPQCRGCSAKCRRS